MSINNYNTRQSIVNAKREMKKSIVGLYKKKRFPWPW
jgi:hypothetical protein